MVTWRSFKIQEESFTWVETEHLWVIQVLIIKLSVEFKFWILGSLNVLSFQNCVIFQEESHKRFIIRINISKTNSTLLTTPHKKPLHLNVWSNLLRRVLDPREWHLYLETWVYMAILLPYSYRPPQFYRNL